MTVESLASRWDCWLERLCGIQTAALFFQCGGIAGEGLGRTSQLEASNSSQNPPGNQLPIQLLYGSQIEEELEGAGPPRLPSLFPVCCDGLSSYRSGCPQTPVAQAGLKLYFSYLSLPEELSLEVCIIPGFVQDNFLCGRCITFPVGVCSRAYLSTV